METVAGRAAGLAGAVVLAWGMAGWSEGAHAQQTLRFHTFVPPVSTSYKNYVGWLKEIEQKSGGKLKIETYGSNQLGGKPEDLYSQVKDGVVDIVYTLPGYTPGLFPRSDVFELPFVGGTSVATSQALADFAPKWLKDEYKDVKPLVFHAPTPPLFHMKGKPIHKLEDVQGRKIRAPNATVSKMVSALGGNAVGIAGANITEAMLRGVVEGMIFPWAIANANKVIDAADTHTVAETHNSVLMGVMNKRRYDGLPADLRKIFDENSGMPISKKFGEQWARDDEPAIARTKKMGHEIIVLPAEERARWKAKAEPVVKAWVDDMTKKGHPGQKLVDDARALVAKYSK